MIDLTKFDNETLMARGAYSTVRAEHEDEKKRMQILTGEMSSVTSQVLRQVQPDGDAVPEGVGDLLAKGRGILDAMEVCAQRIIGLAKQKAALKPQAWGRK
jgi:hypothetical protein